MFFNQIKQIVSGYKGAGVLFAAQDADGCPRVLLGKRTYPPYRGYWSVPAGGMEDIDAGDFRACASREAFEETVGLRRLTSIRLLMRQCVERAPVHCARFPFFEFRTYCLQLATIPYVRFWPVRNGMMEFNRFGWFEMNNLPAPLHPGLSAAMHTFGLRRLASVHVPNR